MRDLMEGILRFQYVAFPQRRELYERLALGQQPQVLFITCSDSRVDPALMVGAEPGELFVLRNAGNIVPPWETSAGGEAGTIELAVQNLRVRHIIICGHTRCTAVGGILFPERVEKMPAVAKWLACARTPVESAKINADPYSPAPLLAVEMHLRAQMANLQTYPFVQNAIHQGLLELHGWVFHLETGEVTVLDRRTDGFLKIEDVVFPFLDEVR